MTTTGVFECPINVTDVLVVCFSTVAGVKMSVSASLQFSKAVLSFFPFATGARAKYGSTSESDGSGEPRSEPEPGRRCADRGAIVANKSILTNKAVIILLERDLKSREHKQVYWWYWNRCFFFSFCYYSLLFTLYTRTLCTHTIIYILYQAVPVYIDIEYRI